MARVLLELADLDRMIGWEIDEGSLGKEAKLRFRLDGSDLLRVRRAMQDLPTEDTESGRK